MAQSEWTVHMRDEWLSLSGLYHYPSHHDPMTLVWLQICIPWNLPSIPVAWRAPLCMFAFLLANVKLGVHV